MSNDNQWAIVELMGHKVVAGMVAKSEMLGKPMLRVDVPATSAFPEFTQFYGETSIYCVTFVSEDVARLTAEQSKVNPVSVYVPDLISRSQYEKAIGVYQEKIKLLQDGRSLSSGESEPEEDANDDDDE
jgi:hypothetical protein